MDVGTFFAADIRTMKSAGKDPLNVKIGQVLKTARKQRGLVGRQVAEHLGVKVGAVGNWEGGANSISADKVFKLAEFLNIDARALLRGELRYLGDESRLSDAEIVTDPQPFRAGPKDVELLGVAAGGSDGGFEFNGEIQGYVQRPAGIANQPRVFALNIISDSMIPRYEPGEMIYCGGKEANIGDYVVIETFPENGETVGKAFVKKLVKRTRKEIVVEQFNPPKEISFDPYAIRHIWRVIPVKELLGY